MFIFEKGNVNLHLIPLFTKDNCVLSYCIHAVQQTKSSHGRWTETCVFSVGQKCIRSTPQVVRNHFVCMEIQTG